MKLAGPQSVAIARLLDQGARRVAYVDVDAHHGDGVQAAFYDDPRVLTISLHEHPSTLFPGTGLPGEIGDKNAEGMSVNVALAAGTRDAAWLRAFDAVVPPLIAAFDPRVLVTPPSAALADSSRAPTRSSVPVFVISDEPALRGPPVLVGRAYLGVPQAS